MVISYGEQADGIVTTGASLVGGPRRRTRSSVVFLKEGLLARNASSAGTTPRHAKAPAAPGFKLHGLRARPPQILPEVYESIHPRTMMPVCGTWTWSGRPGPVIAPPGAVETRTFCSCATPLVAPGGAASLLGLLTSRGANASFADLCGR